ncbi:MAG: acetolactate synthase large subunit [Comamonadaceae bacterium]|nr:acetolactate synthase large subunit [Comamonadaceae bacterium]
MDKSQSPTGADVLVRTLLASGVDTCFANPGTSEMHLVAAIDRAPGMRAILGLFEGVVTGAADGYARMAEKPAVTLLHLGPGLANGLANLHNARKAGTPVINVVGDHAVRHLQHDAPLASDIDTLARPMSHWVGRAQTPDEVSVCTAQAIAATQGTPGCIATLVLPADSAWGHTDVSPSIVQKAEAVAPMDTDIEAAASALRQYGSRALLLLGGKALRAEAIQAAFAVADAVGCRVAAPGSNARMERGGGLPEIPRIPYAVDSALAFLADVDCIVLMGAPTPVAFFAYPDKPSVLIPVSCRVVKAVASGVDPQAAMAALASICVPQGHKLQDAVREKAPAPSGPLTPDSIAQALAHTLPENAIVVDESVTSGRSIYAMMSGSGPFTLLGNMGGSIGFGMPVALGAAIACPDRRVLAMVGDGSAFYTEQALWSLARESANVTVVIFANHNYAILQGEWRNTGAGPTGQAARDMLTLDRPRADWVSLARGHGVEAERVADAAAFTQALQRAHATPGPRLIEVAMA